MMRRFLLHLVAAALLVGAADADAGQFILRARTAADAQTLCERYGLVDTRLVHEDGSQEICLVTASTQSPADDAALRTKVLSDPLTLAFEIDTPLSLAETSATATAAAGLAQSTAAILEGFASQAPADYFGASVSPAYVGQSAAALIRLPDAHRLASGAGTIAIIDTGVDPSHPAIAGALVAGYDFVNDMGGVPTDFAEISQSTAAILEQLGSTAADSVALLNQSTAAILEQSTAAILESAGLPAAFGHGTMVAGLAHLVAPTAAIMPLKAFRADGTAEMSDLVSAIYYAADHGATVINMSFTLVAPSPALLSAIAYAGSRRILLVAAVGNDGLQLTTYPAAWPYVIAVASTTMTDQRSVFSNFGSKVDLSAPGETLITPYPGNHYAAASGTSFATALVSGAVSLLQQYDPVMNESDAMEELEHGASVPSYLGKARIDLYRALLHLLYNN